MATREDQQQIDQVRRFNRSYAQQMGIVDMLGSDLSLAAARVLLEVESREQAAAVDIAKALEMDAGYLSRIVGDLGRKGLIRKRRSPADGRRHHLEATAAGQRQIRDLDRRADARIGAMLEPMQSSQRQNLIGAMATIESILGPESASALPCRIRDHGPGDLGWVVYRHGVFYRRYMGLNERFEALVVTIAASFAEDHDPYRERLWIAEQGGQPIGSVMLTREADRVGRLRLFWVEPTARGQGLGSQLLDTQIEFARHRSYERIVLSTLESLTAARRLYERAGFRLGATETHALWGPEVVEETWDLEL
ncbi:MAG: helix-turn-helix domain-containing GNAT family N-acetyltransferase [Acidobacteriota bacterium]